MKKLLFCAVTAILACSLCLSPCAHTSSQPYSYYAKRNTEHKTPVTEPQFSFTEKYDCFCTGSPDEKVIYLTFDAGYENGNVERILDILKKHSVKGAFFILDNLVRRNTDLVIRMAEEGHTVCNHTARHKDMTKITDKNEFERELVALSSLYTELTGKTMAKYYRPPEGKFNEDNLRWAKELGYKTVFWSFAYADWDNGKQPDCVKSVELVMKNTHNGEIALLHPTSRTNADILDELIKKWTEMGYRFGTLDELCGG